VIVYYAAMSLDGRIAGPDHDLSFLKTLDGGNDYLTFYEGVDSLVMGARTWDFMVLHGSWPYGDKPTWIVTHADELDVVGAFEGAVLETFAGDVTELVDRIGERGYERTWLVGGGELAGQFLAADRLDELILTVAPTLVGRGPALADGEFALPRFTLAEVERYGDDGVRTRYERR
jgi:dihydrofolate reductase